MGKLVSCICLTYKRAPEAQVLLEEAIQSYIMQDYTNKELIILNDAKEHDLVLAEPRDDIVILNVKRRFRTLGEKYNAAIAMSKGDLICCFEDDDLSFPWRLTLSANALEKENSDYYNPKRYWFNDGGKWHHKHPMGYAHNASMFTRDAFLKAGMYPAISGPQDAAMDSKLTKMRWVGYRTAFPLDLYYYTFRWGTGSYHLSGLSDTQTHYDSIGNIEVPETTIVLKPQWREDYVAITRQICASTYTKTISDIP